MLQLLEKKPKIYSDAIKYALACWNGIELSSLFKDSDFLKMDRTRFLTELQETGLYRLENDQTDSDDVIVYLTEQGRDQIIHLFYSAKEQKQLRCLFKKLDPIASSSK